jgi:ubiquinone/menaquinone biosynthesis C-methylase UbiE
MKAISANAVYDVALAYQKTAALIAAIKVGLFRELSGTRSSAAALAEATRASERGIRILCDYLTVIGFLSKEGSTYELTPASSRFLDPSSPSAVCDAIDFLAASEMISLTLDDPVAYVRHGGSSGLASISPSNPVWVRFARAMVPFASPTAKRVAAYVAAQPQPPQKVLDIAAGHGLYGIEVAKMSPETIVTAVDWEKVLAVASANAKAAGLQDRYRTIAGSAFDVSFEDRFDLVLLPNILHHFGHQDCVRLLRKAKAALSSSGEVLAIDFVPNPDRISPPEAATFAFRMLATTPDGDAYTLADYQEMAKEAGFTGATSHPLSPTPETLIIFEN